MLRALSIIGRQLFRTPRLVASFHGNAWAMKRITETVPALGESITEGTIARWNKQEGDDVNPDEVIVVVETDKVTVDIKANHRGVIVKRLVHENVEVGKPLYEIEVDENAVVTPKAASAPTPAKPTESAPVSAPASTDEHKHRKPLIRFLGKRSLLPATHSTAAPVKSNSSHPATTAVSYTPPTVAWPAPKKPQTGVDFYTLKDSAFYGRPKLSAAEIAAIETGGAV